MQVRGTGIQIGDRGQAATDLAIFGTSMSAGIWKLQEAFKEQSFSYRREETIRPKTDCGNINDD